MKCWLDWHGAQVQIPNTHVKSPVHTRDPSTREAETGFWSVSVSEFLVPEQTAPVSKSKVGSAIGSHERFASVHIFPEKN